MKTRLSVMPVLIALMAILACYFFLATTTEAGVQEAVIRFQNGDRGGSGIIVSVDPKGDYAYGVTCAHGFNGYINNYFDVYAFDGKKLKAQLKGWDKELDVAIFAIPAYSKLDTIPIADSKPDSEDHHLVGYPVRTLENGKVEQVYQVTACTDTKRQITDEQGRALLEWNGFLGDGASGGGVICEGQLIGIISAGDKVKGTITCSHLTLVNFCETPRQLCVNGNCRQFWVYRNGRVRARFNGPANHPAAPNPPGYIRQPAPGQQPAGGTRRIQVPPPVAPPAAVDPPAPSNGQAEVAPNIPGPMGPQGPAGEPGPAGKNGVDALADPKIIARITALEMALANLKQVAGPPGPAGQTGPKGPAGALGALGPAGPAGTRGPAGPPGVVTVNYYDANKKLTSMPNLKSGSTVNLYETLTDIPAENPTPAAPAPAPSSSPPATASK